jgi:2-polyprenyl-6-methoxyphenol hydroxylase-like FAD-dependent oxidoreductase
LPPLVPESAQPRTHSAGTAREAGAVVLQGTEITALRRDESGICVAVRDVGGGKERELRGQYWIAADGWHSKVRSLLGIDYHGRGAFSKSLTIYFTADLSPWIGANAWSIIYVNVPVLAGFLVRPDGVVSWRTGSLTTDPATTLGEALGRGLASGGQDRQASKKATSKAAFCLWNWCPLSESNR